MILWRFVTLAFTFLIAFAHNPHRPSPQLVPTLVTAWWPLSDGQSLPTDIFSQHFQKLLSLPLNLVIFGDKKLQEYVLSKRKSKDTKFFQLNSSTLTNSWYYELKKELQKAGQKPYNDVVSPALTYSRMMLLHKAMEFDPFDTDEFIWVDANALASYSISKILQPQNVNLLMTAYKHHFFLLTSNRTDSHVFPNIQKTYFNDKFDTFVSTQLFGGKKDALPTIKLVYEDMLRVVLNFDSNLWSQDALWSMLADRCPFLLSYLSADNLVPPPSKRLLPEMSFQQQKAELENYEWLIGISELAIIGVGVLLGWEVIKFIKYANGEKRKTWQKVQVKDKKVQSEDASLSEQE